MKTWCWAFQTLGHVEHVSGRYTRGGAEVEKGKRCQGESTPRQEITAQLYLPRDRHPLGTSPVHGGATGV